MIIKKLKKSLLLNLFSTVISKDCYHCFEWVVLLSRVLHIFPRDFVKVGGGSLTWINSHFTSFLRIFHWFPGFCMFCRWHPWGRHRSNGSAAVSDPGEGVWSGESGYWVQHRNQVPPGKSGNSLELKMNCVGNPLKTWKMCLI